MTWNEFKKEKLEELRLELNQCEGQVDRDFEFEGYLRGELEDVEGCNGFTDFIQVCQERGQEIEMTMLEIFSILFPDEDWNIELFRCWERY